MAKITFTVDTKNKDKIIFNDNDKSCSLDTDKFLKYLGKLSQKEEAAKWQKLPDNCLAFKKGVFKIKINSYEDYITHRKVKYFVKWPELIVNVSIAPNHKIYEIKVKTKIGKKMENFKAPNFEHGILCFGSYDPKIKDLSYLEKEIKKVFQVPFTEDYYELDPKVFFKTWEEKGYTKAYKLNKEVL